MSSPILLCLYTASQSVAPSGVASSASVLPEGVKAMLEAAISSGDDNAVKTMLRFTRQTHGFAEAEIDLIEARWQHRLAERQERQKAAERAALVDAGVFENWKGQVELGASRSTGNSSLLGLYGSLSLDREGLRWRQRWAARADVQEGRTVTDNRRLIASWQPNYRFADQVYAFGLAQYESDPAQGYDGRYTMGSGIGYAVLETPTSKLELEVGPTFRYTVPTLDSPNSNLAGRASINLRWALTPRLELTQTGSLYLEDRQQSAGALTTIDATLIGPLKSRLSYDVRYESDPRTGGTSLSTLSRATLVYSF